MYALVMSAVAPNLRISSGATSAAFGFTTGSRAGVSMGPCGVSSLPIRPNTSLCVISNRSGIATSWHDDDLPEAGIEEVVHVCWAYHDSGVRTTTRATDGDNVFNRYCARIGCHDRDLHTHFESVSEQGAKRFCDGLNARNAAELARDTPFNS